MHINLHELLKPWRIDAPHQVIKGIRLDSRTIQPGDCFVALPGHKVDGRHYIDSAIRNGAVAVLFENLQNSIEQDAQGVVHIGLPHLATQVSALAGVFYGNPSQHMHLAGVTGTNGKSTVTHLMAQWYALVQQDPKCAAVIGTLGSGSPHQLETNINTTPDAISIQRQLADFAQAHRSFAAMEVSSHGVVQHRVAGVAFDVNIFTNLTRDHLDYHGTMECYAAAKWQFMQSVPSTKRVINADDTWGKHWLLQQDNTQAVAYSLQGGLARHKGRQIRGENLQLHPDHFCVDVCSDWGDVHLNVPLIGQFNAENVLAALGGLLVLGCSLHALASCAHALTPIPGRMDVVSGKNTPLVVVDYAHTPDALEHVLKTLRVNCAGQLWCVVGCGGERDQGKRPLMGQVATEFADISVFTNDNPRTEAPHSITEMMLAGVEDRTRVQVIHDREKAIAHVITHAQPTDTILLAGKGHETVQVVGTQSYQHCDRSFAQNYLREYYD